jgi:hypothetical protein
MPIDAAALGRMQGLLPLLKLVSMDDEGWAQPDVINDYTRTLNEGAGLARPMIPPMGPTSTAMPPMWSGKPTVTDPGPVVFPKLYGNPKQIAKDAAKNTAPEDPSLKALFGVTRDDLYQMSKRVLHPDEMFWSPAPKARGAATSSRVMTPENEKRLVDLLGEFRQNAPAMFRGMHGWYVMDPAYNILKNISGKPEADFKQLNSMGFYSPSSSVMTEINRGTAGNLAWNKGLWDKWANAGLKTEELAKMGFPNVLGHMWHRSAMVPNHETFLRTGQVTTRGGDPKVPLYIQSSLPPELGGQTRWAVPDSHFSRGLGMTEVRPWKQNRNSGKLAPNAEHMKAAEYSPIGPWFYNNVAQPAGLEGVPAQAIQWGGLAHITGVKTPVGAPKLELLGQQIMRRARELGLSKESDILKLRDRVLRNEEHSLLDSFLPVG